jgi:hypothetical protein
VPPRDGDGHSSDGEDGLVAQIIPLRQRAQPQSLTSGAGVADPPATRDAAASERSIWDQPVADLRRRQREPEATPSPSSRGAMGMSVRSWWPVAAALAAALILVAVTLVIYGALDGRAGPVARQSTYASTATAASIGDGYVATNRAARKGSADERASNAQAKHSMHRRSRSHDQRPLGLSSGSSSGAIAAGVGTSAPATDVRPDPASAEFSPTPPSEGARAPVVPASSASKPTTARSECVPGQLGC